MPLTPRNAILFSAAAGGDAGGLLRWAEQQQQEAVEALVSDPGPPPLRRSALHLAAAEGHAHTVRILLSLGADPHVRDAQGATALHLAAAGGHAAVASTLVEAGGSTMIAARDAAGRTALDCATSSTAVLQVLSRRLLESRQRHSSDPSLSPQRSAAGTEAQARLAALEDALAQQLRQGAELREYVASLAQRVAHPPPPPLAACQLAPSCRRTVPASPRQSPVRSARGGAAPAAPPAGGLGRWPPAAADAGGSERCAPPPPEPAHSVERRRMSELERTVVEADEGRVRARMLTQQEVAFLQIVWQLRKAAAAPGSCFPGRAMPVPSPMSGAGPACGSDDCDIVRTGASQPTASAETPALGLPHISADRGQRRADPGDRGALGTPTAANGYPAGLRYGAGGSSAPPDCASGPATPAHPPRPVPAPRRPRAAPRPEEAEVVRELQDTPTRLWGVPAPPSTGGASPLPPGCEYDHRLLTSERQELERELADLRRLRGDRRSLAPSPIKPWGAAVGPPSQLQPTEPAGGRSAAAGAPPTPAGGAADGDADGDLSADDSSDAHGVRTLEARILRRQREIEAAELADRLAHDVQGAAEEVARLLAARDTERLAYERRLYGEAQAAAERDSDKRFAAHRRRLEALEREHLAAKSAREEQETRLAALRSAAHRSEGERAIIRAEYDRHRQRLAQQYPQLRDSLALEDTAGANAALLYDQLHSEIAAAERRPQNSVRQGCAAASVKSQPPQQPHPDASACRTSEAGPPLSARREADGSLQSTPRRPAPQQQQQQQGLRGAAEAAPPPHSASEPSSHTPQQQQEEPPVKVFLTRRERLKAGLDPDTAPPPSETVRQGGTSPYARHAPRLRRPLRVAQGGAASDPSRSPSNLQGVPPPPRSVTLPPSPAGHRPS